MYLVIIVLPLLGSIFSGFMGRKLGITGSQIITCTSVILTTILAIFAFFEVAISNISVYIKLFRWIDSESLNISWGFVFDTLTVSMLIPVLIVSSLVHLYSIGYMSHDPQKSVLGKHYIIHLFNYSYSLNKFVLLGIILSNSGKSLKLLIPNYVWKYISGWSNYSCMVISQKVYENIMGNRGSKSREFIKIYNKPLVKEQRVDDNRQLNKPLRSLRCTLMSSEKNFQLKTRSKYIMRGQLKRFYSSNFRNINPWFVTGLIDAEGSFSLIISKDKKRTLGWRVEPIFQIGLHIKDLELLNAIQQFLGGIGNMYVGKIDNRVIYSINSIKDLNTLFIHLKNYPLLTQKYADFLLFKQGVELIKDKLHLSFDGLNTIASIKASMNRGLSIILKKEFKNVKPVERSKIDNNLIIDENWIVGFVSGEGCFDIRIMETTSELGYRVQLRFRITQHSRDIGLMENIISKLKCGSIYKYPNQNAVSIVVINFSEITNLIIPFFNKYPILGVKYYDYLDWCKAHNLMRNGLHLTPEGIKSIHLIKSGMNTGRK